MNLNGMKRVIFWEELKSNISAGMPLAAQPHNKQSFNPNEFLSSIFDLKHQVTFDLTLGALPDFKTGTKFTQITIRYSKCVFPLIYLWVLTSYIGTYIYIYIFLKHFRVSIMTQA